MGSVMIVVMEPGSIGRGPGFITVIRLGVRPFLCKGAVEPFDLAVGLRTIRTRASVLHPLAQCGSEGVGTVSGAVVGHHPGHGDPCIREESARPVPEPGSGLFAFNVEDLGIRQA